MAFSNIENSEKLDIINIAIINNENFKNNETFKKSFEVLSDENNEERLFNTKYVTEEDAKKLLADEEITGYLLLEDEPKVVVSTNGINETILKYVTEEISQTEEIMKNIAEKRISENTETGITNNEEIGNLNSWYAKIYMEIMQENNANIKNISNKNLSYTMIEFYTLIAMTCLYSGILGVTTINQNLPNMSSKGKRIAVSPTNKGKVVLSSVIASYITALIGLAILFIYTIFVLKVDYGDNLPLIILLGMIGTLAGLSIGIVIRKYSKNK